MSTTQLTPQKSLNKAYRKVKPVRKDIDEFKTNLIALLDNVKENETEEFHKNLIIDFLKKTYYDPDHYVNTRGREDLVIHNGSKSSSTTGVLIEAKSPTNTSEMLSVGKINTKALQELVLYYMRERITEGNDEVRHIIVTNVYEWFIFDAQVFDKCFAQDSKLVKKFNEFESKTLSDSKTSHFYSEIAKDAITQNIEDLVYTHVDLRKYDKPLRNTDLKDDRKLVNLFKIFSPQHLLKQPFANDSNSLDKKFYDELLHIIGLHEEKVNGKKLIKRKPEGARDSASILENTIAKLKTKNSLSRVANRMQYGADVDEQLFNLGLELVITWINRILFLKLLEAQLVGYHKGDMSYQFLNLEMIGDYDQLFTLFHEVLAVEVAVRQDDISSKYSKVPYLNSSLFEIQELEHNTVDISGLKNDLKLPIHTKTVLKDNSKKRTGEQSALSYLFDFLEAYDFSSEGGENIQEDNKNLINASVLGLIFEKINGYKDGSFFTPGFITMYMCRETIRRAVVQKFVDAKGWAITEFDQLYDKIDDKQEANAIINTLKICDPAVGSGHFLVSALNEIMSIKSDLKILLDDQGKTLRDYELEVVNDELVITVDDELFEYHPDNKEASRVQKTLFHAKQTIIENCLFGVDINPNSVKICQLRLWVELLKHAYYNDAKQLETLPNIDINIKCGNSLISRFGLDADLSDVFGKQGYSQTDYLLAVTSYKQAPDKDAKAELRDFLAKIKSEFHTDLYARDPRKKKLSGWRGQLMLLENKEQLGDLFEKIRDKKMTTKISKLKKDIAKAEKELQDEEDGRFYDDNNAFEWRFEFPEVLQENGSYKGFDVVIGNPPYIRQEEFKEIKPYLKTRFTIYNSISDLLTYFVELSYNIMKSESTFQFIISNKFAKATYGRAMRSFVLDKTSLTHFIDFSGFNVFEEATVDAVIIGYEKSISSAIQELIYLDVEEEEMDMAKFAEYVNANKRSFLVSDLNEANWAFESPEVFQIKEKIELKGTPLEDWKVKINFGVKTGYNQAFIIDKAKREELILKDSKSEELLKPLLRGRDIQRYLPQFADYWLVSTFPTNNIDIDDYPAIKNYLNSFGKRLEQSGEKDSRKKTSNKWFETQDTIAYWRDFEKPKLIWKRIGSILRFAYSEESYACLDSTCIATGDNVKYLAAILNSNLMKFELFRNSPRTGTGDLIISVQALNPLPVIVPSLAIISDLEMKYDEICILIESDVSVKNLESQIDLMVYKLYGLTYAEVLMVEESVGDGSFGLSEAEYLAFEV